MSEEDPAIEQFRTLLNEYKRPYIQQTIDNEEYSQDVAKLNDILKEFDDLYTVLYKEINPASVGGGYPLARINENTKNLIIESFKNRGGFTYMMNHPESRPLFKHYLDQDLKRYPFTMKPKQIDAFIKDHVGAFDAEIMPNEDTERFDES